MSPSYRGGRVPSLERFMMKVNVDGPMILDTPCWVWTGATFYKGYGNFSYPVEGQKSWVNVGAHRYLWALSVGPIPAGMKLCHKCDNPPCVRPSHMFVGTQKQNLEDMTRKGRRRNGKENDPVS